jgi:hypothetical protein
MSKSFFNNNSNCKINLKKILLSPRLIYFVFMVYFFIVIK